MYYRRVILSFVATLFWLSAIVSQQVPYGIKYQAVARNSYGDELVNKQIDVRFSIRSGSSEGNLEYQEVHSNIVTSQFGVFDAIIGAGTPVSGAKERFQDITWETDNYFLGIEIKFDNDFIYMGSMQFLSVPYALYAGRSLEPGPEGPPGPPGDPASDDQMLSISGTDLTISDGNTVSLGAIAKDPLDEIQYLSIQDNSLSISGGNSIMLQEINIDDADADPTNEMQTLTYNITDTKISISDGNEIDISNLVNTDNQFLGFDDNTYQLTISNGNAVSLGKFVSFRSVISTAIALANNTNYTLKFDGIDYNDGGEYDPLSGVFTASAKGNYTFYLSLSLPFGASSVVLMVDGSPYETLIGSTSSAGVFRTSITLRLLAGEAVSIVINQTNGFAIDPYSISGSFSGFRVY